MSEKMMVFGLKMSMALILIALLLHTDNASAQSNSQFYGTFNYTATNLVVACTESGTFTIGEDPDQNNLSSSYIYIPVSGTFHESYNTFNFPHGSGRILRQVTISGNSIYYYRNEDCVGLKKIPCFEGGMTITFNSDYTGGTIQKGVALPCVACSGCMGPLEGSFTRSDIDNSRFFGSYDVISETGACLEEAKKLTFGDDFSRRYEENYIYVHRSLTSYTLYEDAEGNGSQRDITFSGNSITIDEVGSYGASMKWYGSSAPIAPPQEKWEYNYVIDFAFGDPPTIAISGHEVDDDLNKCQGDVIAAGTASSAIGNETGTSGGSGGDGGGGGGCFISTMRL